MKIEMYRHIYCVALEVGNLIRWVVSHASYEASGDVLVGREPIYKYGIVLKTSMKSPTHYIIADCADARWHVLDSKYDQYEILSEGADDG